MTTRDVLAAGRLPRHEGERLLMKVTGQSRASVAAGHPLDDETALSYSVLCRRRVAGEPLQYIEGSIPFGGVEIAVDRRALIPRPETELLWEMAVRESDDPTLILDLCTGSGALAVALAGAFPDAAVCATELSPDAAQLAAENAEVNRVDVQVAMGDLFEPLSDALKGSIDLFVSNPPYVADSAFDDLPADVRDWEPRMALVGGPTGTELVERIADQLAEWLSPGGRFYIEIGESQGSAVMAMFDGRYTDVTVRQDLTGRDRYVVGRRT